MPFFRRKPKAPPKVERLQFPLRPEQMPGMSWNVGEDGFARLQGPAGSHLRIDEELAGLDHAALQEEKAVSRLEARAAARTRLDAARARRAELEAGHLVPKEDGEGTGHTRQDESLTAELIMETRLALRRRGEPHGEASVAAELGTSDATLQRRRSALGLIPWPDGESTLVNHPLNHPVNHPEPPSDEP